MIAGKIAPYLLLAAADLVIIVAIGMGVFRVPFAGNVAVFALGAALFLLVTLGMGVLVSTVSQNQGQAIQLAFMIVLPQVLLSGLIFPVSSMAAGVRWISYVLPLTYFIRDQQGRDAESGADFRSAGAARAAGPARRRRARPGDHPVPPRSGPAQPERARRGPHAGDRGEMRWGLEDVRVTRGRNVALAGVTVPVDPSRITAVVGGDGAGKSTCLEVLVGLLEPDAGTVRRPAEGAASGTCRPPRGSTPT